MKKTTMFLLFICTLCYGQTAWINEFHYDNAGGDIGEFVEIAGQAGLSLADWTLVLYNGSDGTPYNTLDLGGSFVDDGSGYGALAFYPSSIQNGAPDGFALVNNLGVVIELISYEGTLTATSGAASGMTSVDVGVSESSSTSEGESLQLSGNPFSWTGPATASPGTANTAQVLPVELTTFLASVFETKIELSWETATEINNYGFDLERKFAENEWNKIGFINGHGNSNSPKYYSFTDNRIENSGEIFYRLKQYDIDGRYEYSDVIEVIVTSSLNYELDQNYPNPFNPTTTITFNIPSEGHVKLTIFNVLGEKVIELLNENISSGKHNISFNASALKSGIYFYKLESSNYLQVRKMILAK